MICPEDVDVASCGGAECTTGSRCRARPSAGNGSVRRSRAEQSENEEDFSHQNVYSTSIAMLVPVSVPLMAGSMPVPVVQLALLTVPVEL